MRSGDWIQTYSGVQYWPLDPRSDDVKLEDIAHSLSNLCRYNGHCRGFYSVAEHSVFVSLLVPPEHALQALLHDATEAYVADVPRPIKRFLTNYASIEAQNWLAIAAHFGVPIRLHQSVKDADNAVLLAEKELLLDQPPAEWAPITLPDGLLARAMDVLVSRGLDMAPLVPEDAYHMFMDRFERLTR